VRLALFGATLNAEGATGTGAAGAAGVRLLLPPSDAAGAAGSTGVAIGWALALGATAIAPYDHDGPLT
jgi:hypothetical protein